jgi:hypothetical protein
MGYSKEEAGELQRAKALPARFRSEGDAFVGLSMGPRHSWGPSSEMARRARRAARAARTAAPSPLMPAEMPKPKKKHKKRHWWQKAWSGVKDVATFIPAHGGEIARGMMTAASAAPMLMRGEGSEEDMRGVEGDAFVGDDFMGDAFVGRFSRDEAQAVARDGALPYLDDIYRGGRDEPVEAGPHDIVISEQDEFLGDIDGDAFVGAYTGTATRRGLMRKWSTNRTRKRITGQAGDRQKEAWHIQQMREARLEWRKAGFRPRSIKRASMEAGLYTPMAGDSVDGDAFVGNDEAARHRNIEARNLAAGLVSSDPAIARDAKETFAVLERRSQVDPEAKKTVEGVLFFKKRLEARGPQDVLSGGDSPDDLVKRWGEEANRLIKNPRHGNMQELEEIARRFRSLVPRGTPPIGLLASKQGLVNLDAYREAVTRWNAFAGPERNPNDMISGEEDDRKHAAIYKAAKAGDPKALLEVDRFVGKRLSQGLASGDKKMIAAYKTLKAEADKGDKRAARVIHFADTAEIETDIPNVSGDAFVGSHHLEEARVLLAAANAGDEKSRNLILTAAEHAQAGNPAAIKAMKTLNKVASKMSGDAFVGAYRPQAGGNRQAILDQWVRNYKIKHANPKGSPQWKSAKKYMSGAYKAWRKSGFQPKHIKMAARSSGLISGDAFVGVSAYGGYSVAEAGAIIKAAKMGNPKARGLMKMLSLHAKQGHPEAKLAVQALYAADKVSKMSGDAFVGDEAKPSPKMMEHLAQIARGLDSTDEGTRGTARSDYHSYVEASRGGDKRAGAYTQIIDKLRGSTESTVARPRTTQKDVLTASLGAICGADAYRMGLATGDEEGVFDSEDGPKDTLDPFFNRPINPYDDAVEPAEDIALDNAATMPESVASLSGIMGAFCGTRGCYRAGL